MSASLARNCMCRMWERMALAEGFWRAKHERLVAGNLEKSVGILVTTGSPRIITRGLVSDDGMKAVQRE